MRDNDAPSRSKYREPQPRGPWRIISTLLLLVFIAATIVPPLLLKRGFNEVCFGRGDCLRGICHRTPFGIANGYCTYTCNEQEDCPREFVCASEVGACVRDGRAPFGANCYENYDCKNRLCVQVTRKLYNRDKWSPDDYYLFQAAFCGEPCSAAGVCEDGSECQEAEDLPEPVCIPTEEIERAAEAKYRVSHEMQTKRFPSILPE